MDDRELSARPAEACAAPALPAAVPGGSSWTPSFSWMPSAGSEMGKRFRSFDWSSTPLGPIETWPQSLRAAVDICLNSRFPMFVWWGPELVNIYNDAYAPILGGRHPQALGQPARQIWAELWPVIGADVDAVVRDGKPIMKERVQLILERNGYPEVTYFTYSHSPIRNDDGSIGGLFQVCSDETAYVVSEARDRFLVALDDAIRPLTDPQEITLTAARLLGEHLVADRCAYADIEADEDTMNLAGNYTRSLDVKSIVGRLTFTSFGSEVLRLMRANEPFVVNDIDTHQPPVGDPTAYRVTQIQAVVCVPLHKDGRFVAAMAVHQRTPRVWTPSEVESVRQVAARCWESIERARVERTLCEREEFYRFAAEAWRTGSWYVRLDTMECVLTPMMAELMGFPLGQTDASAEQWNDSVHPEDRASLGAAITAAIQQDVPFDCEFRIKLADGSIRWLYSHGGVVRDVSGKAIRLHGASVDVTDKRRLADERERLLDAERAARGEAERIGRMKDEFLATLSHELRTPLNAILGWSQILAGKGGQRDPNDLTNGLLTIERNARAQAQIIEDLLDMSRIISGKVRLNVQRVDLASVVQRAIETTQPAAEGKGIRLQTILDSAAGAVSGDPSRLQQVFWNLLSNAVKFTPRGGRIQILLQRVNSQVEISVSDTGEGIKPDFLPFVFDRFRQADGTTTRRHGGLGLGLAIVKQLVELHGGTVHAKSQGESKGATFVVSLPLSIVHAHPSAEAGRAQNVAANGHFHSALDGALRGVRVLVVDDEPDARILMKRLLEEYEAVVQLAGSAKEAIQRLLENPPDVLVSDIGMPEEDGYSLIRQIRALGPERGGNVPAVALTAYARSEDRTRSVLAGYQMHVVKPADPSELVATVASLSKRNRDADRK